MKLCLVPFNPSIGDVPANAKKILSYVDAACASQFNVIVFPDLSLCGAPPCDVFRLKFLHEIQAQVLNDLRRKSKHITIVIGSISLLSKNPRDGLSNTAYIFHNGQREKHSKISLSRSEFLDERSAFEPGLAPFFIKLGRHKIGITFTNADWMDGRNNDANIPDVLSEYGKKSPDCLVLLSATPFVLGKHENRHRFLKKTAESLKCDVVEVNLCGTEGEAIFDGGALAYARSGELILESPRFHEGSVGLTLPLSPDEDSPVFVIPETTDELYQALQSGIRDFMDKKNKKTALIELTGGLGSSLCAQLAVRALGADCVKGAILATSTTPDDDILLASKVAEQLGIKIHFLDLGGLHRDQEKVLKKIMGKNGVSAKALFAAESDLGDTLLKTIALAEDAAFLTAVSKTELAFAIDTHPRGFNADLNILADLTDEVIEDLALALNPDFTFLPEALFQAQKKRRANKPIGSINRDRLVEAWVEERDISLDALSRQSHEINLFWQSEALRQKFPPGLRVTHSGFGRGWKLPLFKIPATE